MAATPTCETWTITSDPKPSARVRGFDYIYFNKPTASGTDCTLLLPPALRGLIRKGATITDRQIRYDEQLGHSVLVLDFNAPPEEGPSLPPDPDTGWQDHDHLTAVLPTQNPRPMTARKHDAAERAAEFNLPMEFLERLEKLARAQRFMSAAIGVNEKPRAQDAQKLVVTAWIDYSRSRGTEFSDEDIKMLRTL
jgi:hypothetical protein